VSPATPNRRQLLRIGAIAVAGLAGCSEGGSDESTTDGGGSESTDTTTEGLDLREANVTDVAFDGSSGSVTFDVTLYHDDDGEDGYADRWQIERLDGTELGRRELAHAHGTRQFTRSATIDVPEDVSCVVVRGHDQTHGCGGQAMLVSLDEQAQSAVQQGLEPQSFTTADCP